MIGLPIPRGYQVPRTAVNSLGKETARFTDHVDHSFTAAASGMVLAFPVRSRVHGLALGSSAAAPLPRGAALAGARGLHFATAGWRDVAVAAPYIVVSSVILLLHRRVLDELHAWIPQHTVLEVQAESDSPILGRDGNREFLFALRFRDR